MGTLYQQLSKNKYFKKMSFKFMIACYITCLSTWGADADVRRFPDGFQFGVATAAYQVEGAWNESDKSESIWDHMSHLDPSPIADGTTGDIACDSYHNYKRDVQMIRDLGVDFYRFSISWPRILPSGFANYVSLDGYEYYNNLIDELLKHNITPMVTIYHWDIPQRLQDLGGWANPLIADWFEDYARVLYRLFGDKVKTWITINEPKQVCVYGYGQTRFAPRLNIAGIAEYMCAKNLLIAHARAWHAYDKDFRATQNGSCGITIATDWRTAASTDPNDVEAGLDANAFETELYSHPIFSPNGGFPERVIRRVAEKSIEQGYPRSRLPVLSNEEIDYIRGTSDFYGFNHYSTRFYFRNESVSGMFAVPSYEDDIGGIYNYTYPNEFESGASSFLQVIPFGVRAALNFIRLNYNNIRVVITENGFSTFGGLDDDDRISYYRQYLGSILDAVDVDGCNVVAYTAWSLMDNFEWGDGLGVKYGLYEVDYDSAERTRTPRKSAYVYREIVNSKALDTRYDPVYPV